jgi:GH24 family phage-related lysozyme (muramidase)
MTDMFLVYTLLALGALQLIWQLVFYIGEKWLTMKIVRQVFDHAKGTQATVVLPAPSVTVPSQKPVTPPAVPAPAVKPSPTDAVTPGLVDFVKKQEGFSAKAFWDFKQWTNGYGTKAASPTEVVDEATAVERLTTEIHAADALVSKKYPNLPLGLHQALIDLTYNVGSGWEEGSLGAAVAAQKMDTIKADIMLYNHAGGQVLAGLTARREAEVKMIDNPI